MFGTMNFITTYVFLCHTMLYISGQTTEDFCMVCQCDGYVDGYIICDNNLPSIYVISHAVKSGNHTLILRDAFDIYDAYEIEIIKLFHNVIIERPPDLDIDNKDIMDKSIEKSETIMAKKHQSVENNEGIVHNPTQSGFVYGLTLSRKPTDVGHPTQPTTHNHVLKDVSGVVQNKRIWKGFQEKPKIVALLTINPTNMEYQTPSYTVNPHNLI